MNAVEIEEAVSALADEPFDPEAFPYAFLAAFGNKATTIKRLRSTGKGSTNKSDVPGGVLQRSNIHLAVCDTGEVGDTLKAILASPTTQAQKAKYALATDGQTIEAENLVEGESLACEYADLPNRFGFFLPLAGITTVKEISENSFDIRATRKLNQLYVELLKQNPNWDTAERREELNHFFARLIFCFFAEDTGIFHGQGLFTATIDQMTERDASNTHEVLAEIFRAMDTKAEDRESGQFRGWANQFPYVNGGLFEGCITGADVPTFTKIARSYLLHIGGLDWTKINPDIFGSMIQAVADDEERGALGMHYTSVPNILKVLGPLFLDELWAKLEEAGDGADQGSRRKLLNLRNRIARIRVFDPACGSGNFLVIAYKQMREIEAEINKRRGEPDRRTEIPLTNYRGIELRHFACEIARLALVIAEFQCDALHRGETLARAEFLPLDQRNWIAHGNALRIDWLTACPSTGTEAKMHADDLSEAPLNQAEIDFENEGGETYICGNPPYAGATITAPRGASKETKDRLKIESERRKADLQAVCGGRIQGWKSLDYVAGWFVKAIDYANHTPTTVAFVSTNSICQGQQVPVLWPFIFASGNQILFAHQSFYWKNLAAHNAGVTVVIIGIGQNVVSRRMYTVTDDGQANMRLVEHINAYLVPYPDVIVSDRRQPLDGRPEIIAGGKPVEGGNLLLGPADRRRLLDEVPEADRYMHRVYGADEYTNGKVRHCLWVLDDEVEKASRHEALRERFAGVAEMRRKSPKTATRRGAAWPHRFEEVKQTGFEEVIFVPKVTAESRQYIPAGAVAAGAIVTDLGFASLNAPTHLLAILNSGLHFVWIATVCGKFKLDYRYSNTLGWNTFPVPPLTEQNKADLTRCGEDILNARESYWPATIATCMPRIEWMTNFQKCGRLTSATMKRLNASISADDSETIPSVSKSCSRCIPK